MGREGNLVSAPVLMQPSNLRVPYLSCLVAHLRTALAPSMYCIEISQPAELGLLAKQCSVTGFYTQDAQ